MATADDVVSKLQNIIVKSNNATGASDVTVSAAVDRLIDGYGSGGSGASLDDVVVFVADFSGAETYTILDGVYYSTKRAIVS